MKKILKTGTLLTLLFGVNSNLNAETPTSRPGVSAPEVATVNPLNSIKANTSGSAMVEESAEEMDSLQDMLNAFNQQKKAEVAAALKDLDQQKEAQIKAHEKRTKALDAETKALVEEIKKEEDPANFAALEKKLHNLGLKIDKEKRAFDHITDNFEDQRRFLNQLLAEYRGKKRELIAKFTQDLLGLKAEMNAGVRLKEFLKNKKKNKKAIRKSIRNAKKNNRPNNQKAVNKVAKGGDDIFPDLRDTPEDEVIEMVNPMGVAGKGAQASNLPDPNSGNWKENPLAAKKNQQNKQLNQYFNPNLKGRGAKKRASAGRAKEQIAQAAGPNNGKQASRNRPRRGTVSNIAHTAVKRKRGE